MLATASPVKLTLYPVQCINMVTNDKTEPFFLEFNGCEA